MSVAGARRSGGEARAVSLSGAADIFILTVVAAVLVLSPLPIGSVRPLPVMAIELLSYSAFIVLLLKYGFESEAPFADARPYVPFLAFVGVCVLQIIPLPESLLGVLSPAAANIWDRAGETLTGFGFTGGWDYHTLSLYPWATVKRILFLLACLAFGIAVSRTVVTKRRLTFVLVPLFALLFFEASLGIYQYLASAGREDASGTFVNRNHFAGYLEMTFPLALGCVLAIGGGRVSGRGSLVKRLVSSGSFQKQALLLFVLGVIFLAVLFSRSRMGILCAVAALAFFSAASARLAGRGLNVKWTLYTVLAVALVFALFAGLYPVAERYARLDESLPSRTLLWWDVLGMVKDFPVFGTGLGTFGYAFPLYKHAIDAPLVYLYSHNDYLQILAETGIAGFAAIMTALALFALWSLRTLVRLSEGGDFGRFFIFLGAAAGVFSILVHSLADFNLHIPSNAIYFAFLIGLMCALGSGWKEEAEHT
jgi:O-antigen ligase